MAHHIYTTECIILRREPLDTSASYIVLTKDLGLIRARAQGVRGVKSRLKGALQEFSLSVIAFVHGRSGWKITTAIPERNFFNDAKDIEVKKIMTHIVDSLIRLIAGEEKSPQIFSAVSNGFSFLTEGGKDMSIIESIIIVRILHTLGYIESNETTSILLKDYSNFSPTILSHTSTHKLSIIKAINNGFQESQL